MRKYLLMAIILAGCVAPSVVTSPETVGITAAKAAPTITSVSVNDSTGVIVGSSFGNNWALDFSSMLGPLSIIETSTVGDDIEDWNIANWQAGPATTASAYATISSTKAYSGDQSILAEVDRVARPSDWQSVMTYLHDETFTNAFISFYINWNAAQSTAEERGTQWKILKINDQNCISDQAGEFTMTTWLEQDGNTLFNYQFQFLCALQCDTQATRVGTDYGWQICSYTVTPDPFYPPPFGANHYYGFFEEATGLSAGGEVAIDIDDALPTEGNWGRFEAYITRGAVDDSTATVEFYMHKPGSVRTLLTKQEGWVGWVSEASCNGKSCAVCPSGVAGCRGPSDPWEYIHFQNYFDDSPPSCWVQGCLDGVSTSNCTPACENKYHDFPDEQMKVYYDDFFIQFDNQRRLYLADDPDIDAAVYLELQEPTYWAADGDSIRFKLNYGPYLSPASAYAIVVDENGDASTGIAVKAACEVVCPDTSLQLLQALGQLVPAYNDLPNDCSATSSGSGPYTYEITFNDTDDTHFVKVTRVSADVFGGYSCTSPALAMLGDWSGSFNDSEHQCSLDDGGPTDSYNFQTWCGIEVGGDTITVEQWLMPEWTSPWGQRMLITVDPAFIQPGARLDNFPVLVELSSAQTAIFTKANTDGSDIRFYSPDGTTAYDYEMVSYDSVLETAEFWVKKTILSSSDNTFWIYYGNGAATSESTDQVWLDYAAVYHYQSAPHGAGALNDSSPNAYNGTPSSDVSNGGNVWDASDLVAGQIGKGWTHEKNRTVSSTDLKVETNQWSLGVWLYHTERGTDFILQTNPYFWLLASQASDVSWDGQYRGSFCSSDPDYRWRSLTELNEWHHWWFVYDGTVPSIDLYYDGVLQPDPYQNQAGDGVCTDHQINPGGGDRVGIVGPMFAQSLDPGGERGIDGMDGIVDEYQLRAGTMSAAWIKTMYSMMDDNPSFLSFSVEKTP